MDSKVSREDFHDALRTTIPDWAERNAAIERILVAAPTPSDVARLGAILEEAITTLYGNLVVEQPNGKGWEIGVEKAVLVLWEDLEMVRGMARKVVARSCLSTTSNATMGSESFSAGAKWGLSFMGLEGSPSERFHAIPAAFETWKRNLYEGFATQPGLLKMFSDMIMKEVVDLDNHHHQNVLDSVFRILMNFEKGNLVLTSSLVGSKYEKHHGLCSRETGPRNECPICMEFDKRDQGGSTSPTKTV